MRLEPTYNVIGICDDGTRFVAGEHFWGFQAEFVRRWLARRRLFSRVVVEPDCSDTKASVPARLAPWLLRGEMPCDRGPFGE